MLNMHSAEKFYYRVGTIKQVYCYEEGQLYKRFEYDVSGTLIVEDIVVELDQPNA